jgi:hypothetical protein
MAADARRGMEAAPALLGEEARSTGEPLVSALPRWSAGTVVPRVEGHSGLTRGPLMQRLLCRRAETLTHTAEREGQNSTRGMRERGAMADKAYLGRGKGVGRSSGPDTGAGRVQVQAQHSSGSVRPAGCPYPIIIVSMFYFRIYKHSNFFFGFLSF